MSKQKDILHATARRHGLNISQANEVWDLLGSKIAEIISSSHTSGEILDPDNFKIIHIDNFGKFIPNKRKIMQRNKIHTLSLKNKK
jgi:hypothetical protein